MDSWVVPSPFTLSSLEEYVITQDTFASSSPCTPTVPYLNSHVILTPDDGQDNSAKDSTSFPTGSNRLLPVRQARSSHQTYSAAHPFASTPGGSGVYSKNSSQIAALSTYSLTSSQPQGRHALPLQRSVPLEPTNIVHIINYVLTQYERLLANSYFRPSPQQSVRFRRLVSCRLQLPGAARWAMYMGAQIFESLLDGVLPQKIATYNRLVQKLEQELHVTPNQDLTSDDIRNRLAGELEVGFLKLRLGHNLHMLQLLRKCAPIFLQIVFSDPTLWPEGRSITAVSVAHILASTRYELSHFIHHDAFYTMAYAIPPTLEYDTSCPPFRTDIHAVEWIPAELHIALIEINARCALGYIAPDWRDIERRILSWQPHLDDSTDDASQYIARLSERESWRQTLLAYLYMAACGVASDDPRVASAVRQIFQLLSNIDQQDSFMAKSRFFVQYLVAGACTSSEKRRAVARFQLSSRHGDGLWQHPGSDFVPLLDHLWHGAAANGRPIRWSDYMASRQAALPIPI